MKNIIVLLVVIFSGIVPALAQSMLKVSLTDRSPITVSIDGRYFKKAGESVTVNDLPPGRHYMEVFVSTVGRSERAMIWEGRIKTHMGQMTVYSIGAYSHQAVSSVQNIPRLDMGRPIEAQGYNNRNLNNYDTREENMPPQENNVPDNTMNNNTNSNTNSNEQIIPENNEVIAPLPEGTPVASPVSIDEPEEKPVVKKEKGSKMDKFKKAVEAKSTDTEKLEAAKKAFKNEKLTTAQVATAMEWFNFENTKVEFAKWAYPLTSDKQNYKNVKQKLTMKNYREEMDKFLRENK